MQTARSDGGAEAMMMCEDNPGAAVHPAAFATAALFGETALVVSTEKSVVSLAERMSRRADGPVPGGRQPAY